MPFFSASGEAYLHCCFINKQHNAYVLMLACHFAVADGNGEDEAEAAESDAMVNANLMPILRMPMRDGEREAGVTEDDGTMALPKAMATPYGKC